MKKLILALTLIVTCALIVGAQDVVYLKNGSVVYGSVIETIPNETVKIQAEDGLVYVYQLADVDRIMHDSTYSPVERFYEPQVLEPAEREDYLQRGFRDGACILQLHSAVLKLLVEFLALSLQLVNLFSLSIHEPALLYQHIQQFHPFQLS